MDNNIIKFSTEDIFPVIEELLNSGKKVKFIVSGFSMTPFIINNRDQVVLVKVEKDSLKIGDIVLFRDKYRKYILHRIYKIKNEKYYTIGDACLFDDGFVVDNQIIGVVEEIHRKGRIIKCSSVIWKVVFFAWMKLLPIRRSVLKIVMLISKCKNSICS